MQGTNEEPPVRKGDASGLAVGTGAGRAESIQNPREGRGSFSGKNMTAPRKLIQSKPENGIIFGLLSKKRNRSRKIGFV